MHYTRKDLIKTAPDTGTGNIAIPGTTTVVYSARQKMGAGVAFCLSAILSSNNGTPSVEVELQVSDTAPDSLEGLVDTNGTDWCIQEGGAPIFANLNDKVFHKITINPTPCEYIRLKLTPLAGNQTDTTGVFKLITQQQIT